MPVGSADRLRGLSNQSIVTCAAFLHVPSDTPDSVGANSQQGQTTPIRDPPQTMSPKKDMRARYPDSPPCSCDVCISYCRRPGWWTVKEASHALEAGYGNRMMLEMSPDRAFGVLAPAYKGSEMSFGVRPDNNPGCTFLVNDRCELHGRGYQPLECRVCHHTRPGLGPRCHADIEREWNTAAGRALVVEWSNRTDFWNRLGNKPQHDPARAVPAAVE